MKKKSIDIKVKNENYYLNGENRILSSVNIDELNFYNNSYQIICSGFSKNINAFLFRLIILLHLLTIVIPKYNEFNGIRSLLSLNQITIKINGKGMNTIISKEYTTNPSEILIGDSPYSMDSEKRINLPNDENIITLKWTYTLITCDV